jgi:hypothetical protein
VESSTSPYSFLRASAGSSSIDLRCGDRVDRRSSGGSAATRLA